LPSFVVSFTLAALVAVSERARGTSLPLRN
jgi:hypothetical protein